MNTKAMPCAAASSRLSKPASVTAADAAAGEVLNVATAEGTSPDPEKPDVPVTPGEDPEPTIETKFTLIIRYWIGSKDGYVAVINYTAWHSDITINDGAAHAVKMPLITQKVSSTFGVAGEVFIFHLLSSVINGF